MGKKNTKSLPSTHPTPQKRENHQQKKKRGVPFISHSRFTVLLALLDIFIFLFPRSGINLVITLTLALFAYQNLFCSPSVINSITQVKLMVHSSYLLWKGFWGKKKTKKPQLDMAAQQVMWQTELGLGLLVKQKDGFSLLWVPPDWVQCIFQTF